MVSLRLSGPQADRKPVSSCQHTIQSSVLRWSSCRGERAGLELGMGEVYLDPPAGVVERRDRHSVVVLPVVVAVGQKPRLQLAQDVSRCLHRG